MNFILIKDIYNNPTIVKYKNNENRGNIDFIKRLIQYDSGTHFGIDDVIKHGQIIEYYINKYLVIDLNQKFIMMSDIDIIDYIFIDNEEIKKMVTIELRDSFIDSL
jgi:hypothetical protein